MNTCQGSILYSASSTILKLNNMKHSPVQSNLNLICRTFCIEVTWCIVEKVDTMNLNILHRKFITLLPHSNANDVFDKSI